jgi:hypothetical protein
MWIVRETTELTETTDFRNEEAKPTKETKNLQHISIALRNSGQFLDGPAIAPLELHVFGSFETNALTSKIIGCAVRVHSPWGPGVYERAGLG